MIKILGDIIRKRKSKMNNLYEKEKFFVELVSNIEWFIFNSIERLLIRIINHLKSLFISLQNDSHLHS